MLTIPDVANLAVLCSRASTDAELNTALANVADRLNVTWLSAIRFAGQPVPGQAPAVDILHTSSPGARGAEVFGDKDPVTQHLRESDHPIVWSPDTYAGTTEQQRFGQILSDLHAEHGCAIASRRAPERRARIELAWSGPTHNPNIMAATAQLLMTMVEPVLHRLHTRSALLLPTAQPVLSPRELECLHWVSRGLTNDLIGKVLEISPTTVRKHVDSAVAKLHANNRTHAVCLANELGLLNHVPFQSFD